MAPQFKALSALPEAPALLPRMPSRRLTNRVAEVSLTEEKDLCVMGEEIYMMHKIKLAVTADSTEVKRGNTNLVNPLCLCQLI